MRHPISAFPPSFTGAPLRNRVDAAATERIAAQYSPHSKSQPAYYSPLLHSLYRVLRAGRREPAAGLFERRYEFPIQGYQPYKHIFHDRILPRAIGVEIRRIFNRAPPEPAKNLLERRFLDFQELLSKRDLAKGWVQSSYIGFTEKGHSTLCRSPVGCFSGKIRADLRRKARAFRTQRQGRVSPLPRSRRQPVRVRKSR